MTNHLAAELRQILADLDTGSTPHYARDRLLRLAEHVQRLGTDPVEVDASTELTASFGLEPEQEIRDRALGHAIAWIGGTRDRNGILDVVETLAAYIRTGERPA